MPRRRVTLMRLNRSADLPLFSVSGRPFEPDVLSALDPQRVAVRYNRTWRLSRPQRIEGTEFVSGKLGFESAAQDSQVEYDDDLEDFVSRSEVRGHGQFSHFIVDLEDRYLLFEERPPHIRRGSFKGALQSILRQVDSPEILFDVDFVPDTDEFESWLERTERVSRFFVSLRQPNPNYDDREIEIRELLEDSNTSRLNLEARPADDGPGLEIRESGLAAFANHAIQGYGTIRGTGETSGARTFFDSGRKVITRRLDTLLGESEQTYLSKMLDMFRSLLPR